MRNSNQLAYALLMCVALVVLIFVVKPVAVAVLDASVRPIAAALSGEKLP